MEQEVYIGKLSFQELKSIVQKLSISKIFLVRGKISYELCGAKKAIDLLISQTGCNLTEFFDFNKNPKIEDLERGLLLSNMCKPDLIIAIGGGSVLDMAKLIRFFYSYSGNPTGESFKKKKNLLPLIAIPTTAGTGSEATHFAVLYKEKIKYSIAHKDILPDVAIVDPSFTYKNPKYLTACTGFDAIAQAIEAYWNIFATIESDLYALKSIKLLWNNLPLVINNNSEELRDKISEAAYWAGKAINITKTTAPHAFSYPFTTYYGYPHGHAVALTFPFFAKYNCEINDKKILKVTNVNAYKQKIKELYFIIGVTENVDIQLYLKKYIERLGLSFKLPENFVLNRIMENANIQRLNNNPVEISNNLIISF